MATTTKMICPNCSAEMNYHAEKLDLTAVLSEPGAADPDLGGVLEEFHTCSKCGKTASWRASS